MDLRLRRLRMLCAIADSGSVGRAAAALGLTQPLSARVPPPQKWAASRLGETVRRIR